MCSIVILQNMKNIYKSYIMYQGFFLYSKENLDVMAYGYKQSHACCKLSEFLNY